MSLHSYSKCWLHIIFGTLGREKILHKEARIELSKYFYKYAKEKNIYMKINYVNSDHPHLLIDLPTNLSIEEAAQLFKGSSSNWINKSKVSEYIACQEEHHKAKSFTEEYKEFISKYGLMYIDEP